ncbi:hypothetical protein GQ54DRAFT_6536 [Martensiomyces pterosporus]|nr:hypothetical protein GQ54DRAFT_6536 [Martensiomyces pterosporus]
MAGVASTPERLHWRSHDIAANHAEALLMKARSNLLGPANMSIGILLSRPGCFGHGSSTRPQTRVSDSLISLFSPGGNLCTKDELLLAALARSLILVCPSRSRAKGNELLRRDMAQVRLTATATLPLTTLPKETHSRIVFFFFFLLAVTQGDILFAFWLCFLQWLLVVISSLFLCATALIAVPLACYGRVFSA